MTTVGPLSKIKIKQNEYSISAICIYLLTFQNYLPKKHSYRSLTICSFESKKKTNAAALYFTFNVFYLDLQEYKLNMF